MRHVIGVTVYEVHPQTPISIIAVPLITVFLVLIISVWSTYFYIMFKKELRLRIETADFDFVFHSDEVVEEKVSFLVRL